MEKVRIVLIDSGVRANHPAFVDDSIKGFSYLGNGIMLKESIRFRAQQKSSLYKR